MGTYFLLCPPIVAIKLHLITRIQSGCSRRDAKWGWPLGNWPLVWSWASSSPSLLRAFLSSLNRLQLLPCIAWAAFVVATGEVSAPLLAGNQFAASSQQSAACESCRNAKMKLYLWGPGTSLKCIDLGANEANTSWHAELSPSFGWNFKSLIHHWERKIPGPENEDHNVYNQAWKEMLEFSSSILENKHRNKGITSRCRDDGTNQGKRSH